MVPTLYWVKTCRRRRVNSSSSMGSSPTISTNWSSTPQRISHSWAVSSASWRRPAWAWAFIWVSRASWRRSSSMKSQRAPTLAAAVPPVFRPSARRERGPWTRRRRALTLASRASRAWVQGAPQPSGFSAQSTSRSHMPP